MFSLVSHVTLSHITYNTHSNVTKYPHARTQVRNCDVLSSVEKNTTQFVAHMCKTRKDVKQYEKRAFMKRLQSPLEVLKMSYEDIPRSLRKGVLENMKIKRSDAFRSILDVLMYMEMSGTLKDEGLRGSFENVSRLDMKCVARDGIDQLRRNSQRLVSARNRLGVRWCSSVRILLTYIEKIKRLDEHRYFTSHYRRKIHLPLRRNYQNSSRLGNPHRRPQRRNTRSRTWRTPVKC